MKGQLEVLVYQMIEKGVIFGDAVEEFEKTFIKGVLDKTGGNQSKAARTLGMHRNTLGRRLEDLGLNHRPKRRRRSS